MVSATVPIAIGTQIKKQKSITQIIYWLTSKKSVNL
ncbi:MAG: hypothetical protein JWP12_981 [Bacteroidetes bacterium]|nr:hypothetical protein [Bacteroidota bacterium]